jgi:hypothetical protein
LAQDHLINVRAGDTAPRNGRFDGDPPQFVGRKAGKRAIEGPHGRAGGGHDDDVGHVILSSS